MAFKNRKQFYKTRIPSRILNFFLSTFIIIFLNTKEWLEIDEI